MASWTETRVIMSTYLSKFGTQRKMDNSPASPSYNAWGPANVEAAYQCLRSLRAIEEQKNCQWCHTLAAGAFQPITNTFRICGWIRTRAVQRFSFYAVFYSAGAWSGVVNFKEDSGGRIHSLDVALAGAGYILKRLTFDIAPTLSGTKMQVQSSTANLYLCHLGIYENEALPEADIYPAQILRPGTALFQALRNRINEMALKESAIGGWVNPGAYAITANSKPATAQCRLYHGKQYVDSKDTTNYKQEYAFHGYVGTMPDLGDLGYSAALVQSGTSYDDIFRLSNATCDYGPLKGGSYAAAAPRSIADLYLWRTNPSAKINLCCFGWWSRTAPYAGRPDVIADPGQFASGEKILESSFVELWTALHYNYLYGCARPVLSWVPPGGAALALTGTYVDYLFSAVPTYSYQRPWGAEWAAGKVPISIWLSATNGSTWIRTVTVKYTWGASVVEDTFTLLTSAGGPVYKEHKIELEPPANLTPLVVSLKIDTDTTVIFHSIWGAISYPLDY